jgi:hypothetical protein
VATVGVGELLYLLDEAFGGNRWTGLLGNLRSVSSEDWSWVPPDGNRTIREIVRHVGGAKLMFENHAFGDASLRWDHPLVEGGEALQNMSTAVDWVCSSHERLRRSIASLSDDDLPALRRTFWGDQKEARWIISAMILHDSYHAGEINHLRALRQGDD